MRGHSHARQQPIPKIMNAFDRAERRAANVTAWAALACEYRALPKQARDLLISDYRHQKATGGTMAWAQYLAVAMPLLPADIRA
jgi:hypothetical protein